MNLLKIIQTFILKSGQENYATPTPPPPPHLKGGLLYSKLLKGKSLKIHVWCVKCISCLMSNQGKGFQSIFMFIS